jgi:phenylalanyl-tRNA synthetase beta chain
MNISYSWLKELVPFDLSPAELASALTRVGLTVEGLHESGSDYVLDLDLTSNRPDCLSHLGVAREIAAITGGALAASGDRELAEGDPPDVPVPAVLAPERVRIEAPDLCYRFTARIIKGVKIGPSPDWLVERLEAVGERSINNIADITNYVMLELGQPMHAFDLDKLAENRIVVRRAAAGEKIRTLDEVERDLSDSMLAICDAEKPIAVAGVMGGLDTGITPSTTNVLLEVAYFRPEGIRRTSRALGLTTEASHRFERGVDIGNLRCASNRATKLITELAGGTADEFVDLYPTRLEPSRVNSPNIAAAVKRLTGLTVETASAVQILQSLGIAEALPGEFTSPTWRYDIAIEEDLVEEVARHTGYEKIVAELPPAFSSGSYQPTEHRERGLRRALTSFGFDEIISYSFIDTRFDETFEPAPGVINESSDSRYVTLRDSVIEGAVRMRATLLPGMLDALRTSFNFRRRDLRLFELGKVFAAGAESGVLPSEIEMFAFAVTGGAVEAGRAQATRPLDFYDAKGALEAALNASGVEGLDFRPGTVKHLVEGQSAVVSIEGVEIGGFGRLSEEIAAGYKFRQPVFVGEINIERALSGEPATSSYEPLPKFPSVVRDVSFEAPRDTALADILDEVRANQPNLLRTVSFVDAFEGGGLPAGTRSVTFRFEYNVSDRTLTDDEVTHAHEELLVKVEEACRIKRRI